MPTVFVIVCLSALALLALAALSADALLARRRRRGGGMPGGTPRGEEESAPRPAGCCGMHAVCEKELLLTAPEGRAEYYDDEELDAYRGRSADSYGEKEIEAFEEVLYTMRPAEVAGWTRSLRLRGIALPAALRDEVLLMAGDTGGKEVAAE